MARPRLALAMTPTLAAAALTAAHWERLHAVCEVMDPEPLATFRDERARSVLASTEVILGHWGCPTLDAAALDASPRLRLLAYAAGSVKERATVTPEVFARGVLVTSAAAANAVPVAEYTLAAVLFANKGVFLAREWYRDPEAKARRPRPVGNYAKVVGVIGASYVGRRVLELLRPFDLTALVYDPYLDDATASDLGAERVELADLLARSDVVSVHAPDLPTTERMIGRDELRRMKDGAVLVNTARGRLVDTDALVDELRTGRISAVLDVTEPEPLARDAPLLSMPNAFVTPHVAGSQGSELARLADLAIEEIERFVAGQPPLHPVQLEDLGRIA